MHMKNTSFYPVLCVLVFALTFSFFGSPVQAQSTSLPDLPGNSSIQFVRNFFDTRDIEPLADIHGFMGTNSIDWLPGSDGAGYFVIAGDGTRDGGYRTSCRHGLWLFNESNGTLIDSAQKAYDPGFDPDGSWPDCAHPPSPNTEAVLLSDSRFMFLNLTGLGVGYSVYDAGANGLSFVNFIPILLKRK